MNSATWISGMLYLGSLICKDTPIVLVEILGREWFITANNVNARYFLFLNFFTVLLFLLIGFL